MECQKKSLQRPSCKREKAVSSMQRLSMEGKWQKVSCDCRHIGGADGLNLCDGRRQIGFGKMSLATAVAVFRKEKWLLRHLSITGKPTRTSLQYENKACFETLPIAMEGLFILIFKS